MSQSQQHQPQFPSAEEVENQLGPGYSGQLQQDPFSSNFNQNQQSISRQQQEQQNQSDNDNRKTGRQAHTFSLSIFSKLG